MTLSTFFFNNNIKRRNLMVSPSGRATQLHERKRLFEGHKMQMLGGRVGAREPPLGVHVDDDSISPGFHSADALHIRLSSRLCPNETLGRVLSLDRFFLVHPRILKTPKGLFSHPGRSPSSLAAIRELC